MMNVGVPHHPDYSENMSSFSISLGHFESFSSMDIPTSASPEAPVFSPITPKHISVDSLVSVVEITGASTPLQQTWSSPGSHDVSPCSIPLLQAPISESLPLPVAVSSPLQNIKQKWTGFKVVIDNIDMNLRPRHQTFERQTKSIHYVNSYAVRDRVDLSCCTAVTSRNTVVSIDSLLPNDTDRKKIMNNFVILAGRILIESIPAFKEIPDLVTKHTLHQHSEEMNSRSEIVRGHYIIHVDMY